LSRRASISSRQGSIKILRTGEGAPQSVKKKKKKANARKEKSLFRHRALDDDRMIEGRLGLVLRVLVDWEKRCLAHGGTKERKNHGRSLLLLTTLLLLGENLREPARENRGDISYLRFPEENAEHGIDASR